MKKSWELPIGDKLGADRIREEMRLVVGEVYAARLGYRCLVPREVEVDQLPAPVECLSGDRLTPLAVYSSNDLSVPVVHLQAIRLPREIAAVHWLQYLAAKTGRQVVQATEISTQFADALLAFDAGGEHVLGRMAATIFGDELFLLSTYVRQDTYDSWAEKMGAVVSSFRLNGVPTHPTIEPRRNFSIASLFELQVPVSWHLSQQSEHTSEGEPLELSNLDDHDVVNGVIQVCAVRGQAVLSELADSALERFRVRGFVPQALERQVETPVQVSGLTVADQVVVVGARRHGFPRLECRILVARGSKHSITLSLLTPVRNTHFLPWAINLRTFQVLAESLRAL